MSIYKEILNPLECLNQLAELVLDGEMVVFADMNEQGDQIEWLLSYAFDRHKKSYFSCYDSECSDVLQYFMWPEYCTTDGKLWVDIESEDCNEVSCGLPYPGLTRYHCCMDKLVADMDTYLNEIENPRVFHTIDGADNENFGGCAECHFVDDWLSSALPIERYRCLPDAEGMRKFYLTGDTRGDYQRIATFCREYQTKKRDVLVVLGDGGLNRQSEELDFAMKERLSQLPVTLLFLHSHYEDSPSESSIYVCKYFRQGRVYYQPRFPNLLFAEDGQIYDFNGKFALAVCGKYEMEIHEWYDSFERLDEAPDTEDKYGGSMVPDALAEMSVEVDMVLAQHAPQVKDQKINDYKWLNRPINNPEKAELVEYICNRGMCLHNWYATYYEDQMKLESLTIMTDKVKRVG